MTGFLQSFARDESGSMLIEMAFITPVMIMLALAGIEVGQMLLRQNELQAAVGRAGEIVLAVNPDTPEKIDAIETFISGSTGLPKGDYVDGTIQANNKKKFVAVTKTYRCGNANSYQKEKSGCTSSDKVSTFLVIRMADTYTPLWAKLGWGKPIEYSIRRTVQIA